MAPFLSRLSRVLCISLARFILKMDKIPAVDEIKERLAPLLGLDLSLNPSIPDSSLSDYAPEVPFNDYQL